MPKKRQHNRLGNIAHMVDRKHPYRALETRSTFALVACLLTLSYSSRILLQAPPYRPCEGERDVRHHLHAPSGARELPVRGAGEGPGCRGSVLRNSRYL